MDFLFGPEPIAWLQQLLGPAFELPFQVLSLLSTTWGILLVWGLALWLSGRRLLYSLVALVGLEAAVRIAVSRVASVARPTDPHIIKYEHVEGSPAFPSGHVATGAVMWGWIAWRGPVPLWLAAGIIVLASIGRVYLGVHYVADVLGALLLAGLLLAAWSRVWPRIEAWGSRRSFGFYAIGSGITLAIVIAWAVFLIGGSTVRWNAAALIAGAAIAMPLEYRWIRYEPESRDGWTRSRGLALWLPVWAAAAFIDRYSGETSPGFGAAMMFGSTLWVLLGAPSLAAASGWSRRLSAERVRSARRIAWTAAAAAALVGTIAVYGAVIEPRLILDVSHEEATIPDLPASLDGSTVAVLSDFQFGMWFGNDAMVRRAVREAAAHRPAAAVIAGDFVYLAGADAAEAVDDAIDIVRPLVAAGVPTFAVLGNHDWGLASPTARPDSQAAALLVRALKHAGVRVLINDAAPVPGAAGGGTLYIVGIGSRYADNARPDQALKRVPRGAPRIVAMHHPDTFARIAAGAAPLAVAGHTHGGQVRVPGMPQWSWLTFASADEVHTDGWIEDGYGAPGNRLYVTRGIGMSWIPVRLFAPPELTLFTLRGAAR